MAHELKYRAATLGLSAAGIRDSDPLWVCSCHEWSMPARPNATRATGNNKVEAERGHTLHVVAHKAVADGIAETYADGLVIARSLENH